MRTLYLCYFGLREPLVHTQVLPYLRELRNGGVEVSLLTFEPNWKAWAAEQREEWRRQLASEGIVWHVLLYHKRPTLPATLYDILVGACKAARLVRRERVDVLHARAHVPMAMAMLAQKLTRCQTVFDIRGLVADEYCDGGVWLEGSLKYRLVKWLEWSGIYAASQIVVLTKRMRNWVVENHNVPVERIEVIPCCVDLERFSPHNGAQRPTRERFEVVYAGSTTGLYLLEEMGRFLLALKERQPDAMLRILTGSPVEQVAQTLKGVGLAERDFWVGKASPVEVPNYLARARIGISFRKPTFSQIAASPTKVPEYLAMGLPAVSNAGIGDTDAVLSSQRVGVIVDEFNWASYGRAADAALALANEPGIEERCRRVAVEYFDLRIVGGARYRRLYRRLANCERHDRVSFQKHGAVSITETVET